MRVLPRTALAIAVVMSLLTFACLGHAGRERAVFRLDYAIDDVERAVCPDAARFREMVIADLEGEVFATDAPLTMQVRIGRSGDRLAGSLTLAGADSQGGAQTFDERRGRCDELAKTIALAAVIAVERLRRAEVLAPAKPKPTPTPLPPRPTSSSARPPPPSPPRTALRFGTLGGVALTPDRLPQLSGGSVLGVSLGGRGWLVALRAAQLLPADAVAARGSVRVQLSSIEIVPCIERWHLVACGLGAVGALSAAGSDAQQSRARTVFFPALGARFGWHWPIFDAFEIQLEGGVDVTPRRPTFSLRDATHAVDVWRPNTLVTSFTVVLATSLFR